MRSPRHYPVLIAIAYFAFISLGLPDAVTGVAWPTLQNEFHIPASYLGTILAGLTCGYFISGILAGNMIRRLGIGGLLSLSCLLVGVAMASNAMAPAWWFLIINAVVWGLGSGAIDAGLNAYAADNLPTKHMSWLHACYSIGAGIGPIAMSAAIVSFQSWRLGYWIVSIAMLTMMVIFVLSRKMWTFSQTSKEPSASDVSRSRLTGSPLAAASHPIVWLHIILFFLYTGLEALIGQWGFTLLTESRNISPQWSGFWISCYFFAIGGGRLMAGFIVNRLGLTNLIQYSILVAVLGSIMLCATTNAIISCISLILIGLGLAAVFPGLMSLTPQRLSPEISSHAIGFQIAAATLGVAAVPGLTGLLVQFQGAQCIAYVAAVTAVALLICYNIRLK